MAYKESIAEEICALYRNAPTGTSEHVLEHYDQRDVRDTVNYLHSLNPETIQDCPPDMTGLAHITFMK